MIIPDLDITLCILTLLLSDINFLMLSLLIDLKEMFRWTWIGCMRIWILFPCQ